LSLLSIQREKNKLISIELAFKQAIKKEIIILALAT
jgi:hypothetical protein